MRRLLFVAALLVLASVGAVLAAPGPPAEVRRGGAAPMTLPRPAPVPMAAAARLFADRPDRGDDSISRRLAGEKSPATLDAILLMCDFADSLLLGRHGLVDGDFPPPMQDEIHYVAHDSVYFDHLLQDVAHYYEAASGGSFVFHWDVHPRVVNLPRPMAWYGNHPDEGDQQILMAAEVVDSLDAEIDFSRYDTVILAHAGAGEETDVLVNSPENIYSTYLDPDDFAAAFDEEILATPYLPTDDMPSGTGLARVLVLPETEFQDGIRYGSLGVYAYEVGLRLGMLPLVDFTPAGNVDSQGIGTLGLMGYGLFVAGGWIPPQPCAFNKMLVGWVEPYRADPLDGATHALTPAAQVGGPLSCARVDITAGEYWLLEYRLQDPDGDHFWSFGGDLNGNFRRDYLDADSPDGRPQPGGKFDPETDTREWLVGNEWDFFMTENATGFGGGGSGVYIWHVDEGVILDVFEADGALFNADSAHKAVDLEEADGIQDLDSSGFSRFYLGADDDAFRGEGADTFGPTTLPPTDTAAGLPTGILFREFGDVVADSRAYIMGIAEGDTFWGFAYAESVPFELLLEGSADGPVLAAQRVFDDGVDLRGSHALIVNLDRVGDEEIVLAGHQGEVFALDGDLTEFLDHDGNPGTFAPFATGERGGEAVRWNLPPAVGNIDGDDDPEIVLTGPNGLYAFDLDGEPVRDAEVGAVGLYTDLGPCDLPPVLVTTATDVEAGSPAVAVMAAVVVREAGSTWLRFYRGADADLIAGHDLGDVVVTAPPTAAFGRLWLAASDTAAGEHYLLSCAKTSVGVPGTVFVRRHDLRLEPGAFPPVWGYEPDASGVGRRWVGVPARDGTGETFVLNGDLDPIEHHLWAPDLAIRSPLAAGGAFVGAELLGRIGLGGDWRDGWPRRPAGGVAGSDSVWAGGPVVGRLVESTRGFEDTIFPGRDGALHARGPRGEAMTGWPLAGPARTAATPAVGRLTGGQHDDLVAIGTFDRITGTDDTGGALVTRPRSIVALWEDVVVEDGSWPMWGGSAWRDGTWPADAWRIPELAASGTGIVAGSHICSPSPVVGGTVQVRARLRSAGKVRAEIYNLEGELVTASAWHQVPAQEPFAVSVAVDRASSGMYVCRLVARHADGSKDHSVVSFAIER